MALRTLTVLSVFWWIRGFRDPLPENQGSFLKTTRPWMRVRAVQSTGDVIFGITMGFAEKRNVEVGSESRNYIEPLADERFFPENRSDRNDQFAPAV